MSDVSRRSAVRIGKGKAMSRYAEERPNSWDLDFDVALPAKVAAAGSGCGS